MTLTPAEASFTRRNGELRISIHPVEPTNKIVLQFIANGSSPFKVFLEQPVLEHKQCNWDIDGETGSPSQSLGPVNELGIRSVSVLATLAPVSSYTLKVVPGDTSATFDDLHFLSAEVRSVNGNRRSIGIMPLHNS
ncbi:hypothetical protein [Kocuria atrinae]|uniref:hypothetical protein n=1 Tax=Kocuria atrinae TaxID=592377 RepID=UPI0031D90757